MEMGEYVGRWERVWGRVKGGRETIRSGRMGRWEKAEIGRDEEREGDDRSGYVGVREGDERHGCVRGREMREVVM